jgi:protein-S-isoprenylcysteine O-methyltransferase Ste14
MLVFATGLFFASPFILALTPVLALAILKLAVEAEERHLIDRFGDDYRSYLAQTPRWL